MKKHLFVLLALSIVFYSCQNDDGSSNTETDPISQPTDTIPTPDSDPDPQPDPYPNPNTPDPLNFEPYFQDSFDSYEDGRSLSRFDPFDAAGNTSVSSEQSYSGDFSAKMEIRPENDGGFGTWGGIVPINPAIPKGGEVWTRLRVFWPESFEFSASPWMKFLRFHNRTGDGANGGYNDLYIHNADGPTSVLRCIKEFHNQWEVYDGNPIPRDTWETYEMYLFVDDVSVDNGGNARMRIWRDGELIFDRTDVPTITDAQGVIESFYLFTYWNNENPPNNFLYVDDLVIATHANPPINTDAEGNAFIGN